MSNSTNIKSSSSETVEGIPKDRNWLKEFCEASNIHGLSYVARRDFHWLERIFWIVTILAAAYNGISSCYSQWARFRNTPTIFEYEYVYMMRNFQLPGITFCTKFPKLESTDQLIYDTWHINATENIAMGEYYRQFLFILNNLKINNLDILKPYENDTTVNVDFIKVLLSLQESVLKSTGEYVPVVTEMGLCQTNSQLAGMATPYKDPKVPFVLPTPRNASFFSPTQIQVKPSHNYTFVELYMHDVNDFVMPFNRRSTHVNVANKIFYLIKIRLRSVGSEDDVRHLPLSFRNCRFPDESNLVYFKTYFPGLCRQECRINRALQLCHCKPFFYVPGPASPICDVKGMLCLHRKKWILDECKHCLTTCPEINFIVTEDLGQSESGDGYKGEGYERIIQIIVELPKMGIKRRVVFSTDQLIMSFGGAIGLFLGASFLTIYSLIYLGFTAIFEKCKCRLFTKKKIVNEEA